ncbi:MAG TPA: PH domain-containing protein [Gaiellaceae bacterium]|nr:PH domain-containing protein [Gaiellaceae bacterium]
MILREPAETLDPRMRTVWAVEGAITVAALGLVVAAAVVVLVLADASTAAWSAGVAGGAAVIASAVVLVWLLPTLSQRHFRYEVMELGLYVARGWLWRRWQVVPHARIQTVDIKRGPLLRAFGLVAVQVATAAAGGGTDIPGLAPGSADALVEELAQRAGIEEGT